MISFLADAVYYLVEFLLNTNVVVILPHHLANCSLDVAPLSKRFHVYAPLAHKNNIWWGEIKERKQGEMEQKRKWKEEVPRVEIVLRAQEAADPIPKDIEGGLNNDRHQSKASTTTAKARKHQREKYISLVVEKRTLARQFQLKVDITNYTKKNNNVKPNVDVISLTEHTYTRDKGVPEWVDDTESSCQVIPIILSNKDKERAPYTWEEMLFQLLGPKPRHLYNKVFMSFSFPPYFYLYWYLDVTISFHFNKVGLDKS
ncbi:hypothetical protein Cgig2_023921 [Carnegiea gigantea]|uniref:Uncharacterized protein n=1 Tax=Carnegiea gigantea TaxID=171969 RepID=A0A9Q1JQB2_9CARY|nr:hypothetical protein Cgig2_023921 [Carnegiea gigantea]